MKRIKKHFTILLLIVPITLALAMVLFLRPAEMPLEERIKQDVAASHETLSSLLENNPGQYIKKDHPSFQSFASLFSAPLEGIDTRTPEYAILSFENIHPESNTYLYYTKNDSFFINEDNIVTAAHPEVNLENLGVNGKGYIHCIRLQEGWFLSDSYLPT